MPFLDEVGSGLGMLGSGAMYALETPGALLRGLIGSTFGNKPFGRMSGRDMLNSLGATSEDDTGLGADALGFGAGMLADPLAWGGALLGGLGLSRAAGRAATRGREIAGVSDEIAGLGAAEQTAQRVLDQAVALKKAQGLRAGGMGAGETYTQEILNAMPGGLGTPKVPRPPMTGPLDEMQRLQRMADQAAERRMDKFLGGKPTVAADRLFSPPVTHGIPEEELLMANAMQEYRQVEPGLQQRLTQSGLGRPVMGPEGTQTGFLTNALARTKSKGYMTEPLPGVEVRGGRLMSKPGAEGMYSGSPYTQLPWPEAMDNPLATRFGKFSLEDEMASPLAMNAGPLSLEDELMAALGEIRPAQSGNISRLFDLQDPESFGLLEDIFLRGQMSPLARAMMAGGAAGGAYGAGRSMMG